jgi:hypothetical protein
MTFPHLSNKKVDIFGKEHLELLILVLLPFRGFLVNFYIANINKRA